MVQEERYFKRFLNWSSGDPLVQWSRTIYAILKEGMVGNSHVKLYEEKVYGWMTDKDRSITIPRLQPSAQVS